MNRMEKHNLYNIKHTFAQKTGVRFPAMSVPTARPRVLRPAVLAALILVLCLLSVAFTYPLFSPLDGDALTLNAAYEGDGIVSIQVENRSHKRLEFQPQTKLVKWITGEEVTPLADSISFSNLKISPRSTETITLDLSGAYDIATLEQSKFTEWYYLVLTNGDYRDGQEWKCSVFFGEAAVTQTSDSGEPLYSIDSAIVDRIEEELRFYFEDDYYGIFAGNPLHYEYMQKAQELLLRSGKTIVSPADVAMIVEPVKNGIILDENYPAEKQYNLDGQYPTVRDEFGKLVGFQADHHVEKLCVHTDDGWQLPILYFVSFDRNAVDSGDCYTFLYGQLVSLEQLEEHRIYEDTMFYSYDVTHLFYTDLRSYFDEVVATDPGYYENAEYYWPRIQNVYNYYKENMKLIPFDQWQNVAPHAHIENHTERELLVTQGLQGTLTANYDIEKILIEITKGDEQGEVYYAYTAIPRDPRFYDLADAREASDALKTLPDGKYTMRVTVWLEGTEYMNCQSLWSCVINVGSSAEE